MGNRQNPYVKLERSTFGTFGTASPKSETLELDDPGSEKEPSEAKTLLSLATDLYEAHKTNLRKNNLPIENAHVYLDELKEYAAQKGIRGKLFQKAYLTLIDSASLIYDDPYVRINDECT